MIEFLEDSIVLSSVSSAPSFGPPRLLLSCLSCAPSVQLVPISCFGHLMCWGSYGGYTKSPVHHPECLFWNVESFPKALDAFPWPLREPQPTCPCCSSTHQFSCPSLSWACPSLCLEVGPMPPGLSLSSVHHLGFRSTPRVTFGDHVFSTAVAAALQELVKDWTRTVTLRGTGSTPCCSPGGAETQTWRLELWRGHSWLEVLGLRPPVSVPVSLQASLVWGLPVYSSLEPVK